MTKSRFASFALSALLALVWAPACTRAEAIEDIPAGTEVTVVTDDGDANTVHATPNHARKTIRPSRRLPGTAMRVAR